MERVARAIIDANDMVGFIHAKYLLEHEGPLPWMEWPALRAEGERLKEQLVDPLERSFEARFLSRPRPTGERSARSDG
jgi:hypothetical protein